MLEEVWREAAGFVALALERAAILLVAIGGCDALGRIAVTLAPGRSGHGLKKEAWRRFGTWLLLGLEFELAAEVVRSVISPTWIDIGRLGAIAVIRTFLNYFLEQDLEHAQEREEPTVSRASHGATVRVIP
jgi:uncharacterized membrane protein